MAVSNTDDHFRNHGFLLTSDGWKLSPMYDVNPGIYGEFLSLNVDADNSAIDFELAISAAPYYGIAKKNAEEQVKRIKSIVGENWRKTASLYGIGRNEAERMEPAFSACA